MKTIFLRIMESLLYEPNWSSLQGQESSRRPKKVSDVWPHENLYHCPQSPEGKQLEVGKGFPIAH